MNWAELESGLHDAPRFHVEAPDGRREWTEIERQVTFRRLMATAAPRLLVFANANAGKRNPRQAKREGILGGVFDLTILWRRQAIAYVEFKGYDARGRAGKLSQAQIDFGNRLADMDVPCACFFSPYSAIDWLREQGFPIAEVRHVA